jgi:MFS family permease
VIDDYGLRYGGLHGWIAAIDMTSIQAPLTTAAASLVFALVGLHVTAGFVVPLAAGAGCILAAALLGHALGPRRVGLMAAVLTASCPVIIIFSRTFQFATPAALVMTLALVAILRSQRFARVTWAAVFGLCLGLMPLARTMTIAFLPGLVAAALVVVMADPHHRPRSLALLLGSLVLAVLVSATWLWPNGRVVAQYLVSYGYGGHALDYGPHTSALGLDAWQAMLKLFGNSLYLPHLLMVILGGLGLLAITLRSVTIAGVGPTARRILHAPALPVVIVAADVFVTLTTSNNKGSGFFAPIVPSLMALTAWSLWRLSNSRRVDAMMSILVAVVAILGTVPSLDLRSPLARHTVLRLPVLADITVTDGRGRIQIEQAFLGYGVRDTAEPIDRTTSRAWVTLSRVTADWLTRTFGAHATIAFAFRNGLYNVNTVNLQELLHAHSAFAEIQIDPAVTRASVAGYGGWLKTEAASACALLTSDRPGGDFLPAIDRPMMAQAARQAGFVQRQFWPAPDGQIVMLWVPAVTPPHCRVSVQG